MKKKAETGTQFITGSELARRLGVTEGAVRKAVEAGRVVPAFLDEKGRRWFTEESARQQWNASTLPEKSTGRLKVASSGNVSSFPSAAGKIEEPGSMSEAQKRCLAVKAELDAVKLQRMKGELVQVDQVARAWERQVEQAKRLLLALPNEIKIHVPHLTVDDMTLLENRIIAILNNLASWNPLEAGS